MKKKRIFTSLLLSVLFLFVGAIKAGAITYEAPEGYYDPITYTYDLSDKDAPSSIVLYPGDTLKILRETPSSSTSQYTIGIVPHPDYATETSKYYTDAVHTSESNSITYESIKIKGDYPVVVYIGGYGCGAIDSTTLTNEEWRKRATGFQIEQLPYYYLDFSYSMVEGWEFIQGEDTNPTKIYLPRTGDTTVIPLKSPVKEGCKFKNWQVNSMSAYNPNGLDVSYLRYNSTLNGATPIFISSTYSNGADHYYGTVKLDANEGTIEDLSSKIYEIEFDNLSAFVLSNYVPVRKGYTFAGWYSNSDLTTKVNALSELSSTFFGSETYANRKTTLYAKWVVKENVTTYKLNVNTGTGFKTNPEGTITVEENDNATIVITVTNGYKLKSVKLDGVEKISTLIDGNKLVLNNITNNHNIVITSEKIVHPYMDNTEDQTYIVDKNTELTVRLNADYSLFSTNGKVYIDGKLVDASKYTSRSGSTIITFNNDYLSTLTNGTHILNVAFNDGTNTSTTFIITNSQVKETQQIVSTKTVDNIASSIIMIGLSIMFIAGYVLFLNKKKKYN